MRSGFAHKTESTTALFTIDLTRLLKDLFVLRSTEVRIRRWLGLFGSVRQSEPIELWFMVDPGRPKGGGIILVVDEALAELLCATHRVLRVRR